MPPACSTPGLMQGEGEEEDEVPSSSAKVSIDGEEATSEREVPRVVAALAAVLDRLVARNEQFANTPSAVKKLTIFHGLRAPSISIAKYLERVFKYTSCSPSCFLVGYIFIDRLIHRQPDLLVTSLNVHRLLITSLMVATKTLDDIHFNNAFFARVGGVSVVELNRLELEFLFRLDFRVTVTIGVFESYCSYFEKQVMTTEKKTDRSLPVFGSSATTSPRRRSQVVCSGVKHLHLVIGRSQMKSNFVLSISELLPGSLPENHRQIDSPWMCNFILETVVFLEEKSESGVEEVVTVLNKL